MMTFMRIALLVFAFIHLLYDSPNYEHDTGYIMFAIYLTGSLVLGGVDEVSRKLDQKK